MTIIHLFKSSFIPSLHQYLSPSFKLNSNYSIDSSQWQALVQKAMNHRVLPLLYKKLSDRADQVPADLMAQLKEMNNQTSLKAIALTGELINLIEILEEHHIPAIAYKGPILSLLAYGSISARAFDDLDIWVQPQHFFKPKTVLEPYGYQAQLLSMLSPQQEQAFFGRLGEYLMVNSETQIHLDVHGRCVAGDGFAEFLDLNCFWDRLETINLMGRSIQTLCCEDLVLYLCIGAGKDGWPYLKHVCDLATLIERHPNLDWDQILQEARRLKMEQMLRIGLLLIHSILAIPLNDRLLSFTQQSRSAQWISQRIAQRLTSEQLPLTTDPSLERFLVRWIMLDTWKHKFSYLSAKVIWNIKLFFMINDLDYQFFSLPRPLYFLYYGIRPIRLLYKYRNRLKLNF